MMKEVYDICDDAWRGIGIIPNSGLALKDEYAAYDAERALPIELEKPSLDPKGCQCGRVLQGLIKPSECPLFGKSLYCGSSRRGLYGLCRR